MAGEFLQRLCCLESGVGRTMSVPYPCVAPPCPLTEVGVRDNDPDWNRKTIGYILCYCLPLFVLHLIVVLVGPQVNKSKNTNRHQIPFYFTKATTNSNGVELCTYPLVSTILLGLFDFLLTAYLWWLGRRILKLVINKGLQKSVYMLILSHILGISLWCAGICICFLVYRPVADFLALGSLQDFEARRRLGTD